MMRDVNRGQALCSATPSTSLEVFVPQSLYFRLADLSEVTTLFDIRQAAIRQLSLTHLSECEAAAWAERGGVPRVEGAIAKDEVWVAALDSRLLAGFIEQPTPSRVSTSRPQPHAMVSAQLSSSSPRPTSRKGVIISLSSSQVSMLSGSTYVLVTLLPPPNALRRQ